MQALKQYGMAAGEMGLRGDGNRWWSGGWPPCPRNHGNSLPFRLVEPPVPP
jgi:hypothetical protein